MENQTQHLITYSARVPWKMWRLEIFSCLNNEHYGKSPGLFNFVLQKFTLSRFVGRTGRTGRTDSLETLLRWGYSTTALSMENVARLRKEDISLVAIDVYVNCDQ